MADHLTLPAHRLARMLADRHLSARELAEAAFARIDALNPGLNAIVVEDRTAALAEADAADARLKAGTARPLEGLPITIKDAFDVAGLPSTGGVPAYAGRIPQDDARAVAALRAAGAIIFGKTNVPFFSGDFQSYNPLYGITRHFADPDFSPGGSSGGAAVAVATGMSAFELGSDLGGSLRWPAHCCGIYALKTTWNLIPTWGHVPPPPERRIARNADLMVAGPLARDAGDLALVLDVLAGDNAHLKPAVPIAPRGLRVALWARDAFAPADASVIAAVEEAARALEREGAIVDADARPDFSFAEAYELAAVINHAIVAHGLPQKVRDKLTAQAGQYRRGDLSHAALQSRGARMAVEDYADVVARRAAVKAKWADFFTRFDVVLCPPAPVGPIRHDHRPLGERVLTIDGEDYPYLDFLKWSSLATGGDLPAAVAPVREGPDGLPRGVQIIAGAYEDRKAIAVAGLIGTLGEGYKRPAM